MTLCALVLLLATALVPQSAYGKTAEKAASDIAAIHKALSSDSNGAWTAKDAFKKACDQGVTVACNRLKGYKKEGKKHKLDAELHAKECKGNDFLACVDLGYARLQNWMVDNCKSVVGPCAGVCLRSNEKQHQQATDAFVNVCKNATTENCIGLIMHNLIRGPLDPDRFEELLDQACEKKHKTACEIKAAHDQGKKTRLTLAKQKEHCT